MAGMRRDDPTGQREFIFLLQNKKTIRGDSVKDQREEEQQTSADARKETIEKRRELIRQLEKFGI